MNGKKFTRNLTDRLAVIVLTNQVKIEHFQEG